MPTLSDAPTGRDASDPPAFVDLRDPAKARAWLAALRETVLDCSSIGEDATRSPKRRMFSRFEARRRMKESEELVLAMLDAAERGLGEGTAE